MAVFSFPSKKQNRLSEILKGSDGLEYLKAMTADNMLTEAQNLLSTGQREKALTLIRKAKEKLLLNSSTEVHELLFIPELLRKAERKNEGWMFILEIKEFFYRKCEEEQYPNYKVLATESDITKTMCEFLSHENKLGYCFYMTIKGYLEDTTSTFYLMNAYMQKEILEKNTSIKDGYIKARKQSESYMNIKISDSYIKNVIFSHLIKARKKEKLPEVLTLVKDYISHIPKIDYIKLEEDLLKIMKA